MIIQQNSYLLGYFCKLLSFIGILRIKFDPRFNVVHCEKNPSNESWLLFYWRFATFLVAIYILQYQFKQGDTPSEAAVSKILIIMILVSWTLVYEIRNKSTEIEYLLNSLFHVHSILPGTMQRAEIPLGIRINIIFAYAAFATGYLAPIGIVYGLHWRNPCKSSLIGNWLIPQCCGHFLAPGLPYDVANSTMEWVILLINHWMWTFWGFTASFVSAILLTFSVRAIHQFISRLIYNTLQLQISIV